MRYDFYGFTHDPPRCPITDRQLRRRVAALGFRLERSRTDGTYQIVDDRHNLEAYGRQSGFGLTAADVWWWLTGP